MYILIWCGIMTMITCFYACDMQRLCFKMKIQYFWRTSKQDTSDTCSICLESMEKDSVVRKLVCGHTFHPNCINNWLVFSKSLKCPLCQKNHEIFSEPEHKIMQ